MDAAAWRLVGILSVPHWLYAFIWFWPKAFQALCGKTDAVDVFSRTAYALKGTRGRSSARAQLGCRGRERWAARECAGHAPYPRCRPCCAAIQFAACYVWCTQDAPLDLLAAPLPRIAACLALGAAGQA
jgi:hypothetical protein